MYAYDHRDVYNKPVIAVCSYLHREGVKRKTLTSVSCHRLSVGQFQQFKTDQKFFGLTRTSERANAPKTCSLQPLHRHAPTVSMRPKDNGLHTYHYECSTHSGSVLTGLCSLWQRRQLFDVTLVASGQQFHAHRVVLAACSDYFRAMFTDGMKECEQSEIELNGVEAVGLCHLLEYMYTTKITLNLGNVQEILGAASHLQILPIVDTCSTYLHSQLDLDNCVDILTIAQTYSLQELIRIIYCYLGQNLDRLVTLPEFQRLSLGQIVQFLQADFPISCREVDVLQAVLCWINHNCEARCGDAATLFKHINFQFIKRREFQNMKRCTSYKDLKRTLPNLPSTLNKLMSGKSSRRMAKKYQDELSCLINPRGFRKAIVNIGGFNCHRGLINDLTYLHPEGNNSWKRLTTIPHVEQCDFGVAVLDNELYVIGGCFNQSLQEHIHPFGFRYNPRQDKWMTIAPMLKERCRFFLAAVSRKLYAIGGLMEQDSFGEECEMYSPETDLWTEMPALPQMRMQHSGASIRQTIYISGGIDAVDNVNSSMLSYNVSTGSWTDCSDMLMPRADHCMVEHSDKLFVAGGWYEDDVTGDRVIVETVDSYCIHTDQWQTLTQMPTPRYHASMTIVEGTLYLVGGFGEGDFNRATRKIETFDIGGNEWRNHEDYPVELWEHSSCVLYVPTCRNDKSVSRQSDLQNLRRIRPNLSGLFE